MKKFRTIAVAIILAVVTTSCSKETDTIEPIYDFVLETAQQHTITQGEIITIECKLIKSHFYSSSDSFTYGYSPTKEVGELRTEQGTKLKPNQSYSITEEVFTLYYTSYSTDNQAFEIYAEDNKGNIYSHTIDFTYITAK